MTIKHITRDEIDQILEQAGNHFLSVTFQKADASIRTLQGHLHVKKHLKGGDSTIAHKPDLVSIFDIQKSAYRCFNKSRVKSMRVNGNVYKIGESE